MRFPPFIISFPFVFELPRVSVLKYIHSITLAQEGKGSLGKDSREEVSQKKENSRRRMDPRNAALQPPKSVLGNLVGTLHLWRLKTLSPSWQYCFFLHIDPIIFSYQSLPHHLSLHIFMSSTDHHQIVNFSVFQILIPQRILY